MFFREFVRLAFMIILTGELGPISRLIDELTDSKVARYVQVTLCH